MKTAVILAIAGSALGRTFTVYNACPFTIWPAIFTDLNVGSSVPAIENGWEAPAYSKRSFTVPDDWKAGRIWGRTQCDFSTNPGIRSCLTGGCNGGLFTLDANGQDYTDVSLVDGFNLPMRISNTGGCGTAECTVNLNKDCPDALKGPVDANGDVAGCKASPHRHACVLSNPIPSPPASPNLETPPTLQAAAPATSGSPKTVPRLASSITRTLRMLVLNLTFTLMTSRAEPRCGHALLRRRPIAERSQGMRLYWKTMGTRLSKVPSTSAQGWGARETLASRARRVWSLRRRKLDNKGDTDVDWLIKRADEYFFEFERSGELGDLEEAIECSVKAIALTTDGYPNMHVQLASLSVMYYTRFQSLGNLEDLDKDITYSTRAYSLTPEGHPIRPARVGSLATSFLERFRQLGDLGDLDKAVEYSVQAYSLTPEGHSDLHERLRQLGSMHHERFLRLDDLRDLEKGIEYRKEALSLIPKGHPDLPEHLTDLGVSYYDRFIRLGDLGDLNKSLEYHLEAQSCFPEGEPIPPEQISHLAASYFTRFQHLGDLDDLDKAIAFDLRAISLTPEGNIDMPERLSALGASYHERFMRLGDLGDIEKAIEYRLQAFTLTPETHPTRSELLSDLGISYHERFVRLEDIADLEQAIKYKSESNALTPKGHPELPDRLSSLGTSYHHRFIYLSDRGDMEKAIEYEIQAHSLTPEDHSHMLRRLSNLGTSYHVRFAQYGDIDDLNEAIRYKILVHERTPEGHPEISHCLSNLGLSYEEKFNHLGESNDLHQALEYYRKSCYSVAGNPQQRLDAALAWARLAVDQNVPSYLEAYQTAIELIPEVIWIGTTVDQRYATLVGQLSSLATEAGSVAISSGQYSLALEWLEQGRSVVWNQTLLLQSPLDSLSFENPSLATQLQNIRNRLQNFTLGRSTQRVAPTTDLSQLEQAAQERHQLAKEYAEVISHVRKLPGFENFLRPKPSSELFLASQTGPVVIINVHKTRCDALILQPGSSEVKHLALESFTHGKAQDGRLQVEISLGRSGTRERATRRPLVTEPDSRQDFSSLLGTLWDDVAHPILAFLEYMSSKPVRDLPHITWCTTGPLSFLPLHAAGYYNRPRAKLSDYAISSYAPTLTALLSSTPPTAYNHSSIVAISQEVTSGLSSLPGTARELECIKSHAGDRVTFKQLTKSNATPMAVLDMMEQHDWVHLACHAYQNVADPTQSGFFLYNATLDLSAIMQRSFKNKGLAFLSACQTATGDKKLADEAAHLASCMLIAGYPSVIATMWTVRDSDAPFVADKVYGVLLKNGANCRDSARALHYAVEELKKDIGDDKFEYWAPFIHIGW